MSKPDLLAACKVHVKLRTLVVRVIYRHISAGVCVCLCLCARERESELK